MRTTAVAVLGLFCGFLAATLGTEVVARLVVSGRPAPETIAVLGWVPQVGALVGLVAAILIDRVVRRRAARDAR